MVLLVLVRRTIPKGYLSPAQGGYPVVQEAKVDAWMTEAVVHLLELPAHLPAVGVPLLKGSRCEPHDLREETP